MALTRRIARPLLASIFIAEGVDAIRDPGGRTKAARGPGAPVTRWMPSWSDDPERFVQINGAVQIGAGALLAVGRFRRLASLALIGSIVPATYAGHRFWEEEDDASKAQQRAHFLRNLGLLGGLLLATFDTEGEPSIGWRARRRAAQVGGAVASGKAVGSASAKHAGNSVAEGASTFAHHAHDMAVGAGSQVDSSRSRASRQAHDVAAWGARQTDAAGQHLSTTLPEIGQQLTETLTEVGKRAADSFSRVAAPATAVVLPSLITGMGRARNLGEQARDLLEP